ncbi:response regulator receiver domain-containing protein [Thermoflavifilum aggregans]|uniref:Response regulator receiver domain-containing protein n=1 Tax=Thermoflavifilum aggregans TaxID=454188 RepID=A0A2M9CXV3_9BACT|nr:response regulator transcription factor [Thermoflavifilum aggregans]PJJ76705.1 response regulator receiver domain-containing protein [Thermoflavifilum aggregans]
MAKKILIIEDEPVMLKTLELLFRKKGYEVVIATNGKEAMEQIRRHAPDAVITDVMMPYLPGTEIISRLRHELKNEKTPVVVISSVELDSLVEEVFALGANDFIRKPIVPAELVARVEKLLVS